jgi:hypothetical protein
MDPRSNAGKRIILRVMCARPGIAGSPGSFTISSIVFPRIELRCISAAAVSAHSVALGALNAHANASLISDLVR